MMSGIEGGEGSSERDCEDALREAECRADLAEIERRERLAAARTEVEVERTLREDERRERERVAREATVRDWREEQDRRRRERREARRRLVADFLGSWHKRNDSLQGQAGTSRVLAALAIPALLAMAVYAFPFKAEVLGVALLTAAASFAAGALLGFLFGIPRSVRAQGGEKATDKAKEPLAAAVAESQFAPNTNLEQISDWLTKILVGVGLVQIHAAGDALDDLAGGLAPGLGNQGESVAIALMVSFSIAGFVSAYLFTRLRLQSAFELAGVIREAVKQRANTETSALALVHKQLDPVGDGAPPPGALAEALKSATRGIRSQAFYLARDQRRANWLEGDRRLVAQTIPVFEALIACDTENRFHRNHGELGYALKDQAEPNFQQAKAALERAISIRPEGQAKRFWPYEFNLAYCEIELDAVGFKSNRRSFPDLVARVVSYLQIPAQVQSGREAIKGEGETMERNPVPAWIELNSDYPEVRNLRMGLDPHLNR